MPVGFLKNVFGSGEKQQAYKLLETSYTNLKFGIFARLVKNYRPHYGEQQANLLAVAVIHEALIVEPANADGQRFRANHQELILSEAALLGSDPEIAEAFSHFYAAASLLLVYKTGSPISDQGIALANRATELALYIPSTYDICGSGDFGACVHAISAYAAKFIESAPSV